MRGKIFWFVFLMLQESSRQKIRIEKFQTDKPMTDSILKSIKILAKLKMSFWYSQDQDDLITDVLKTVNVPVVLNTVERPKKRGLETRTFCEVVIIFNDVNADRILGETLWNGDTRFLIVAKEPKEIEADFKGFWKYKVMNIFAFIKHDEDIHIYSFLPYQKGNCASIVPEVVEKYAVNVGNFSDSGDALKDGIRIKNMNGCPINITVVDVKPNVMFHDECGCNKSTSTEGIEGNLMNEVARKLNFNATFVIALDGIGWGWINPSPHGAVGEVFTGRSDFAIGLLAPTIERYESLDISLPYNGEECITYGVPTGAGARIPTWITIFTSEFNPVTWILILLSFILVTIFLEFVNVILLGNWLPGKLDIVLFVFLSFLSLPVKNPKYFLPRLSLLFWIIFSFVITVAYKSSMGSKLAVPNKDPDINTFQELLDSNLEFTGYNNMLRLLQFSEKEPIIQKMIDRFEVTNFDIDFAVDQIVKEKKIAYVRHTTTFLYYSLISAKAKGHVHIIKDCIYLYHPVIVTKKHSPFSNRLNQLVSRLMESGITRKWRSDYIYSFPLPTKPFLKLSIYNMYGVFCILGFGYIFGLLIFLMEILYFRYTKKLKHVK